MEDFRKVVNPGKIEVRENYRVNVFCRIEYKDGRLSITGVVGPLKSGDCTGGAGQIDDELKNIKTTGPGWTRAKINKFRHIWDEWHLNDMSPMCEHQRALGWDELSMQKANLYHWTLSSSVYKLQKTIQKEVLELAKTGQSVQLNAENAGILALPLSLTTTTEECPFMYEPSKWNYTPHIETKTLGWLYPSDHPDGILTKPCPECGYKYGSSWVFRAVPEEVLEWLFNLPETTITPAWV